MRPDFTSEGIELYCGDCREILPHLGKVDAVVTDPPYGIDAVRNGKCFSTSNACKTNNYEPIIGDSEPFNPCHLIGFDRVCLFGANHYSDKLPARARWLIWDKRDGLQPNPLADVEMDWTNDTRPARLFHHRWMGMVRDSDKETTHPSEKPLALMLWCMSCLEVPIPATVIDPYMGSGTTGIACLRTGRKFIGIEISPKYFEIAKERIIREQSQLKLNL
jgi:site-specific DNA-methyltransferase (adenine-specific)/modification methylase